LAAGKLNCISLFSPIMSKELSKDELNSLFEEYVKLGNDMPPQSADNMLIAYAYYKQALIGDNHNERPATHSDVIRTFKHDAWKRLEGMDQEEAKKRYIAHIQKLIQETKEEGRM
jgi:diazepam-binding inhibitor (GABA receptor modulating acyl-CoA-binding protein)